MSAIIGTALVAASIVLFAWTTLVFRNPAGPPWREVIFFLEGLACLIVGLLFVGGALLLQFALQFGWPANLASGVAIVVLAPAAFVAAWRAVGVSARLARFDRPERPTAPPVSAQRRRA